MYNVKLYKNIRLDFFEIFRDQRKISSTDNYTGYTYRETNENGTVLLWKRKAARYIRQRKSRMSATRLHEYIRARLPTSLYQIKLRATLAYKLFLQNASVIPIRFLFPAYKRTYVALYRSIYTRKAALA